MGLLWDLQSGHWFLKLYQHLALPQSLTCVPWFRITVWTALPVSLHTSPSCHPHTRQSNKGQTRGNKRWPQLNCNPAPLPRASSGGSQWPSSMRRGVSSTGRMSVSWWLVSMFLQMRTEPGFFRDVIGPCLEHGEHVEDCTGKHDHQKRDLSSKVLLFPSSLHRLCNCHYFSQGLWEWFCARGPEKAPEKPLLLVHLWSSEEQRVYVSRAVWGLSTKWGQLKQTCARRVDNKKDPGELG